MLDSIKSLFVFIKSKLARKTAGQLKVELHHRAQKFQEFKVAHEQLKMDFARFKSEVDNDLPIVHQISSVVEQNERLIAKIETQMQEMQAELQNRSVTRKQ